MKKTRNVKEEPKGQPTSVQVTRGQVWRGLQFQRRTRLVNRRQWRRYSFSRPRISFMEHVRVRAADERIHSAPPCANTWRFVAGWPNELSRQVSWLVVSMEKAFTQMPRSEFLVSVRQVVGSQTDHARHFQRRMAIAIVFCRVLIYVHQSPILLFNVPHTHTHPQRINLFFSFILFQLVSEWKRSISRIEPILPLKKIGKNWPANDVGSK